MLKHTVVLTQKKGGADRRLYFFLFFGAAMNLARGRELGITKKVDTRRVALPGKKPKKHAAPRRSPRLAPAAGPS